jgi:hypothetical protein
MDSNEPDPKVQCAVCGMRKPQHEFHRAQLGRKTRKPWCKLCCRDYQLQKKFGLSRQQYVQLLAEQDGCCKICGSQEPATKGKTEFCVDHDHKTGCIRGLLCTSCNRGLGFFRDDVELLQKAIAYLKEAEP